MHFQLSGNRTLAAAGWETSDVVFLFLVIWLEGVLLSARDRETPRTRKHLFAGVWKGHFCVRSGPFPGRAPPPHTVWYSHLVGAGVHEAKTLQFNSCRDPGLVELWILTFSIVGQVTETKLLDFTFVNIPGYLTDLINVYSNIWRNKGHCSILLGMKACLSTGKNGFLNCWFATCVWDFACECW